MADPLQDKLTYRAEDATAGVSFTSLHNRCHVGFANPGHPDAGTHHCNVADGLSDQSSPLTSQSRSITGFQKGPWIGATTTPPPDSYMLHPPGKDRVTSPTLQSDGTHKPHGSRSGAASGTSPQPSLPNCNSSPLFLRTSSPPRSSSLGTSRQARAKITNAGAQLRSPTFGTLSLSKKKAHSTSPGPTRSPIFSLDPPLTKWTPGSMEPFVLLGSSGPTQEKGHADVLVDHIHALGYLLVRRFVLVCLPEA